MRTVYGNHERFENTYFKKFPGFYVTGDGKPLISSKLIIMQPFHFQLEDEITLY